jgi:hypothetical protein
MAIIGAYTAALGVHMVASKARMATSEARTTILGVCTIAVGARTVPEERTQLPLGLAWISIEPNRYASHEENMVVK